MRQTTGTRKSPGEKVINVALHEGFAPDPSGVCVTAEAEGQPSGWREMGDDGPQKTNSGHWDHLADNQDTAGDKAQGFMPHFDQNNWLFRGTPPEFSNHLM